jgi:hypothetical protein
MCQVALASPVLITISIYSTILVCGFVLLHGLVNLREIGLKIDPGLIKIKHLPIHNTIMFMFILYIIALATIVSITKIHTLLESRTYQLLHLQLS